MNKYYTIFIAICVLFNLKCNDFEGTLFRKVTYDYIGFDSLGDTIITGWLKLNLSDTTKIIGEWHFKSINNSKDIGQQTGDGKLMGEKNGSIIGIDLNPWIADNNVVLYGKMNNNEYFGKWEWQTLSGVANKGYFKAIKKIN